MRWGFAWLALALLFGTALSVAVVRSRIAGARRRLAVSEQNVAQMAIEYGALERIRARTLKREVLWRRWQAMTAASE